MVIGGFAKRLKNHFKNDPEISKYTEIILGETSRLERLVKQVRRLAEVQSAELIPGSILPVFNRTIKAFKSYTNKQNIDVQVHVEKDIPDINIDEDQMFTAISNIVENALESMGTKGQLTFRVGPVNNNIVIEISDTGSGIEDNEIDTLYDPFVTSKTTGAGLGLTMVHQIILNHGGEIITKSKKNEGTSIQIKLPVLYPKYVEK